MCFISTAVLTPWGGWNDRPPPTSPSFRQPLLLPPQARMEALARQLEQRRAEEEELARLQREVEALRGHLGEEEGGAEAEGEAEGPGHGHGEDPEAAEFPPPLDASGVYFGCSVIWMRLGGTQMRFFFGFFVSQFW